MRRCSRAMRRRWPRRIPGSSIRCVSRRKPSCCRPLRSDHWNRGPPMKNVVFALSVCLLAPSIAFGDDSKGTVQVPLDAYQRLLQASQPEDPAASGKLALGEAKASVQVGENGAAEVQVELTVRI